MNVTLQMTLEHTGGRFADAETVSKELAEMLKSLLGDEIVVYTTGGGASYYEIQSLGLGVKEDE